MQQCIIIEEMHVALWQLARYWFWSPVCLCCTCWLEAFQSGTGIRLRQHPHHQAKRVVVHLCHLLDE